MKKDEVLLLFGPIVGFQENAVKDNMVGHGSMDSVLEYLSWNDLLRLRRVCKDAKKLTDRYINENGGKHCPEITIHEARNNKEKTLTKFLQLGFPTTRIYIMNFSGSCMFETESSNFTKLIEKYGSKIKHVRVHKLSSYPGGMEKKFYEGLTHFESLVVDQPGGTAFSEEQRNAMQNIFTNRKRPKSFKRLKKFTMGNPKGALCVDLIIGSRSFMDFCGNLEYCADAYCSLIKLPGMTEEHFKRTLSLVFGMIGNSIEERKEKFPEKPNLKYYDFVGFHEDAAIQNKCIVWFNTPAFFKLIDTCEKNSVKLLNVNAAWLQDVNYTQWDFLIPPKGKDESSPVVSMVNMHGAVVPLEMKNLEKLWIPATSKSCLLPFVWKVHRRPWPKLKVLDVTVDSSTLYTVALHCPNEDGSGMFCTAAESTESLMQFLFVDIKRPALTEVSLKFVEDVLLEKTIVEIVAHLGSCCPNLKKLSLVNWAGSSETLAKALSELNELEEIFLKKCKLVGDSAFKKSVGADGSLIHLKKVRKVSLKVLDKMPNITDALFKDVLSHMKLTHLFISSKRPLSKVTSNGIRSLQTGAFASTIEKFPFTGWSLAKESKEDFLKLGKGFRSSQML